MNYNRGHPSKTVDIVSIILTIAIVVMSFGLLGNLFGSPSLNGSDTSVSIKADGSLNLDGSLSVDINNKVNKSQEMTIYFKPNTNWKTADARFAVYLWGNGVTSVWYDLAKAEKDGYYKVTIPNAYADKNIIFCRMNPSNLTNNWDNGEGLPFWNQTCDLKIPYGDANCFVMTESSDAWSNSSGEWLIYPDCVDKLESSNNSGNNSNDNSNDHNNDNYNPPADDNVEVEYEDVEIYFSPYEDSGCYVAYIWEDDSDPEWFDMVSSHGSTEDGSWYSYILQLPLEYSGKNIIFCALTDPEGERSWDNVEWQTPDLVIINRNLYYSS